MNRKRIIAWKYFRDATFPCCEEGVTREQANYMANTIDDLIAEIDAYGGMIAMDDLVDGRVYVGEGRNFNIGTWRAEKAGVEGIRQKYTDTFLDVEYHWNDMGTFKPYRLATKAEAEQFIRGCLEL